MLSSPDGGIVTVMWCAGLGLQALSGLLSERYIRCIVSVKRRRSSLESSVIVCS